VLTKAHTVTVTFGFLKYSTENWIIQTCRYPNILKTIKHISKLPN